MKEYFICLLSLSCYTCSPAHSSWFLRRRTKYKKKLVMGSFAGIKGRLVPGLYPGNKTTKKAPSIRRTFSLFLLPAGSWHSQHSLNLEAEPPFGPSSPAVCSDTEDVAGIPGPALQDLPTVSPGTGKFFCN